MHTRYILLWLPMVLLAFANAALREMVLVHHFDALTAHQLSTLTLSALCLLYTLLVFPALRLHTYRNAFITGITWTALTVLFEFFMGWITHRPWSAILHDYNLLQGRVWALFLGCLLCMPAIVFFLRKKNHS